MDTPTLAEALAAALDARAAQIHTAVPARVVSYDAAAQTADVAPATWTGATAPPVVPRVPVVWPQGGGGYLLFPLHGGDTGLLVACEADISEWRRTGEEGPAADAAVHHQANAVFIPGCNPAAAVLSAPAGATVLDGAGDLRLGSALAVASALLGSAFTADLGTWLAAHTVWVNAVAVAVPALAGSAGTMTAATTALQAALPGHESGTVKVAP